MAAATVAWILLSVIITQTASQTLRQYNTTQLTNQGICKGKPCNSLKMFKETYKNCVVVLGNLIFSLLERTTKESFENLSFPNLREVTGFFVVYLVNGLDTLGRLFPNLARIRGEQLLNNYGLIVHDMSTLSEIGLYGLLKVDRGGIIVWGVPQACFVDTVDWRSIAPRSRHVINIQDRQANCNFPCTCSTNSSVNHCWNNKKCQIYTEGPEVDKCNDQCLGCRKTNSEVCSICRHYTHNQKCVSECPPNTIVLPDCQYCITVEECKNLSGFIVNKTCIFHCPIDYVEKNSTDGTTYCEYCADCDKICKSQRIQTTSAIQAAASCVYINGSLEIHIRAAPEAMEELRTYLNRIEEVSDYILIYGSITISSLDFLSSLKRIRGRRLRNGKHSFIVHDMTNLQTLFTPDVTKNLKIDRGTLKMYNNPMLCTSQIEKIKHLFPLEPDDIDIPQGMNGYSGGCEEVSVGFQIRVVNETSAIIMFSTIADPDAHYSILYVRLPPGIHQTLVPETCSDSEWYAVNSITEFGHQFGIVELTSLRPASTYAVCIETYDPIHRKLARSAIANFTTLVGIPEPPFITELVASSYGAVVIRWVNHKDYRKHIKYYELDVSLIEIYEKDIAVKDQCEHAEAPDVDLTRHAIVMKPPAEYMRGCESMCGILSSVTAGALVEEHFDICSNIDCNHFEEIVPGNTTFGRNVKTLVLNLTSPKSDFQVGGLAPFRDYRFRLRACTDMHCSRFARGVVRTLPVKAADLPSDIYVNANEFGHISVKWDRPNVTNGPILSYSVEVLPKLNHDPLGLLMPQTWCVLANVTSHKVKSLQAKKYLVRVCTKSMASDGACSDWKMAVAVTELPPNRWWIGLICGLLLYTASVVIGFKIKRVTNTDAAPIISSESSLRNESEPPSKMFADFAPVMYSIPLRETRLE